jgi:hypothetical protein
MDAKMRSINESKMKLRNSLRWILKLIKTIIYIKLLLLLLFSLKLSGNNKVSLPN